MGALHGKATYTLFHLNAVIYSARADVLDRLNDARFNSSKRALHGGGFVDPDEPSADSIRAESTFVGKHIRMTWRSEERKVPAAEIKEALAAAIRALEDEKGRRATLTERRNLKTTVKAELLLNAKPTRKTVDAVLDAEGLKLRVFCGEKQAMAVARHVLWAMNATGVMLLLARDAAVGRYTGRRDEQAVGAAFQHVLGMFVRRQLAGGAVGHGQDGRATLVLGARAKVECSVSATFTNVTTSSEAFRAAVMGEHSHVTEAEVIVEDAEVGGSAFRLGKEMTPKAVKFPDALRSMAEETAAGEAGEAGGEMTEEQELAILRDREANLREATFILRMAHLEMLEDAVATLVRLAHPAAEPGVDAASGADTAVVHARAPAVPASGEGVEVTREGNTLVISGDADAILSRMRSAADALKRGDARIP